MNRVQLKGVLRRKPSARLARAAGHHDAGADEDPSLDRPRRRHHNIDLLGEPPKKESFEQGDDIGATERSSATVASSGGSAGGFADVLAKEIVRLELEEAAAEAEQRAAEEEEEADDEAERQQLPLPGGEPSSEYRGQQQSLRRGCRAAAAAAGRTAEDKMGAPPSRRRDPCERDDLPSPSPQKAEDDNDEEDEDLSDLSTSDSKHRREAAAAAALPRLPPRRMPTPAYAVEEDDDDDEEDMGSDDGAAASDDEEDGDGDAAKEEADRLRREMEALRAQLKNLRSENERLKSSSEHNLRPDNGGDLLDDDCDDGRAASRWERYRRSSPAKLLNAAKEEEYERSMRGGRRGLGAEDGGPTRRRSCMSVKTLDESLHSHGLSRHGRSRHGGGRNNSGNSGADAAAGEDNLSVGFQCVEVRHYPRSVGDHPCVGSGPPVTIGWDHDPSRHSVVSVDRFEECKVEERMEAGLPLSGAPVKVLTRDEREGILKDVGHSRKELTRAVRDVERLKRARRKAIHNVKLDWFDDGVESAGRKLKRLVLRKKKDTKLYDRWRRSEEERARAAIAEENEAAQKQNAAAEMEAAAAGKSLALSDDDDSSHMINGYSSSSKKGKKKSAGGGEGIQHKFSFGIGKSSSGSGSLKQQPIAIEEDSTHYPKSRKGRGGGMAPRQNSKGAVAA